VGGGGSDVVVIPSCLDDAAPVQTYQGAVDEQIRPSVGDMVAGEGFDLWDATLAIPTAVDNRWYPVILDVSDQGTPQDLCLSGGFVYGAHPTINALSASWTVNYTENSAATFVQPQDSITEGTAIYNVHDGHRVNGGRDGFVLRDVWYNHVRDDCVENDTILSGRFERVLFDGCYAAFSTRPGASDTTSTGAGKVITLADSLIRLEPQPGPHRYDETTGGYLHLSAYDAYNLGIFGHGNIFKRPSEDRQATWELVGHNIFFLEDGGRHDGAYDFPTAARLGGCEAITIIWVGDGTRYGRDQPEDYPSDISHLSTACDSFELVTDPDQGRALWESAVNDWFRAHPDVGAAAPSLPSDVPTRPADGAYTIPPWPRFDP
jgi:hypothetical protein